MKANKYQHGEKKPNMQNTPTPKNMNDNFLHIYKVLQNHIVP